jgi:hypothetical protein
MHIEQRPIDAITPYHRNARKIPAKAIEKVAASIREFGWQQPIVVDTAGVIIVGHTRHMAARKLGLLEVPVVVADKLSPAQVKAYRLMDNRSHEEASWDDSLLSLEVMDIKLAGMNLELTGFDLPQIEGMLASGRDDGRADEAPELPEVAVTQPGDVWLLGRHRVICGDSTNEAHVGTLLGTEKPFLMVTDPPYGVSYEPEWRQQSSLQRHTRQSGKVANDDRADWTAAYSPIPWIGRLRVVWILVSWPSHRRIGVLRIRAKEPDYLGETSAPNITRALSLATRTLLVRSQKGRNGQLARRPKAVDIVASCEPQQQRQHHREGHWARHAEAGRAHAASDPEPHQARRCRL